MSGLSLERLLEPGNWQLAMLSGSGGSLPARLPHGEPTSWRALSRAELGDLDLDRVAAEIVEQYTDAMYPGVVIGANHGSAAYLAALIGAPWLPSGIEIAIDEPDGISAADMLHATQVIARRLRTVFPEVAVSQRYPGGRLRIIWGRVPRPYRRFVAERVLPGGPVLVVRDVCPVQVLRDGADNAVQLEWDGDVGAVDKSPASGQHWVAGVTTLARPGFTADVLRVARLNDLVGVQLLFNEPHRLSQLVADATRVLLHDASVADSWLVIQHGCRVDTRPLTSGAVQYWCADDTGSHASATEWWLAASEAFRHIDLALEPLADPRSSSMRGWTSVCRFASVSASVDLYDRPTGPPVPVTHITGMDPMPYATATDVLGQLAVLAKRSGVLLT
jgi:hypothetical protein